VSPIPPGAQLPGAAAAAAGQAAQALARGAVASAASASPAGGTKAAAARPPQAVAFPPAELRAACEDLLKRYPTRQAALIPVLHLAQRHYGGWVSPEVEAGVADYLGVGDAHVRGVLTFYSMFHTRPVGRHEVWVCRTLTCWLRGAEGLTQAALAKAGIDRVGGTDAKGRFTVREMECLGLCEVAPAVWVDGQVHGHVTPEALGRLMDGCA
jgi:NADH-quinone oxidoreductase subunit E